MPLSRALDSLRVLGLANVAGKNPFLANGIAILSVLLATGLRFAFNGLLWEDAPFVLYYPAIMLTTFFCGLYPGIVALLGSTILSWYLLLPPAFSFALDQASAAALILFFIVASLDVVLVGFLVSAITKIAFQEQQARLAVQQQQQANDQIGLDLEAMRALRQTSSMSVRRHNTTADCLNAMLDAAILITGADKGNIQLIEPKSATLIIAAHREFAEPFLSFFAHVGDEASACASALRSRDRVIVQDVTRSPIFEGTPALRMLLDAGVRSVQSTPLINSKVTCWA
jgi:K+-sensing histidine kinase KdpD